jgi:hypothetical protein
MGDFLRMVPPPAVRRRVFVSYHHGGDAAYYREFVRVFDDRYDVVHDASVDRVINSDDAEYVIQRIRDEYLTGSSCTVVLCGAETPRRKFVDWEIKATLERGHALVGVNLPTNSLLPNGNVMVPNRLSDNIRSGYAVWTNWNALLSSPDQLAALIHDAVCRSGRLIQNARPLQRRNG